MLRILIVAGRTVLALFREPRQSGARLKGILHKAGVEADQGSWIEPDRLLGCAYPKHHQALASLTRQGISVLVNVHEKAHPPGQLGRYGLSEVHIPVRDFTAPSDAQLAQGVAAIRQALASGERVAVHCGAGLGRTGTFLACYLVEQGVTAEEAIERVRRFRPGSIETKTQLDAVHAYAASHQPYRPHHMTESSRPQSHLS